MRKLVLKKPVLVTGRDYFGRNASLLFTPVKVPGWYWKYSRKEEMVPISREMLQNKTRRLSLKHHKSVLNVIEHIAPLRMTGLDGVCLESSPWPPYHGRTVELWDALKMYCEKTEDTVPWFTIAEPVIAVYPNDATRFTQIESSTNQCIEMKIIIDYPKIGKGNFVFVLPGNKTLESLFSAKSPGLPKWLYYPSRYTPHLMMPYRPRHETQTWPQETGEVTIPLFARHRALDFLGALMLADHQKLLGARCHSEKSGHYGDLQALLSSRFTDQVEMTA